MSSNDQSPFSVDEPLPVVGVVGLGLLGRGITACLLSHGFRVVGFDRELSVRASARRHVEAAIDELVRRGGFDPKIRDEWPGRYSEAGDVSDLSASGFVIESIVEDLQAKERLFERLEDVVGPTVPLASNTSALPITVLQSRRRRPQRLIGMHWAEPCHLTRFLEIIRGEQTDDRTAEAAMTLGRQVGKQPALVRKDVPGFIVNRLGYAMYREAFWLLEQGVADVETIDRAFRNAMSVWANIAGPFRWMDLTGLPAYAAVMSRLFPTLSVSQEVPSLMQQLVADGAKGITNGRGFYNYTPEESLRWEKLLRENVWKVRQMTEELAEEGLPS